MAREIPHSHQPAIYTPTEVRIKEQVVEFSYPRMAGSDGEKRALSDLLKQLKQINVPVKAESVDFIPDSFDLPKKITIGIGSLYVILAIGLFMNLIPIMIGYLIGILIMECLLPFFKAHPRQSLTQTGKSKNLIVELPSTHRKEFDAKNALLILCAHYDSMGFRIFGRFLLCLSFGGFVLRFIVPLGVLLLCIFQSIFGLSPIIFTFEVIIGVLCVIPALWGIIRGINRKINSSPGGADNATGIVTLLHLIERIKETKPALSWCDMRFLLTAAEEFNYGGAAAYVSAHRAEFQEFTQVFCINLDTISSALILLGGNSIKSKQNPHNRAAEMLSLTEIIRHQALTLKIPLIHWLNSNELGGDHCAFQSAAIDSCALCSRPPPGIHSPKDTPDTVDPRCVQDAVELVFNVILSIDQQIGMKMSN